MESLGQTRIKLAWWLSSSSSPNGNRTLPFVFITSLGCRREDDECVWLCVCMYVRIYVCMSVLQAACVSLGVLPSLQQSESRLHKNWLFCPDVMGLIKGSLPWRTVVTWNLLSHTVQNVCALSVEVTLLFGIVPPSLAANNIGFGHFIAFASEYLINTQRL